MSEATAALARSIDRTQTLAALAIALAAVAATFTRYAYYVGDATGVALRDASFDYFSFFTTQSNLLVAAVTTSFAIGVASGRMPVLARPAFASAVCLYISVTGVVYFVVLSPLYHLTGASQLSTEALHYVVPPAYAVFWLVLIPKGGLRFRTLLGWLFFPAGYGLYTIVRGAFVGFYPYPFVDVASHGYAVVIANVVYFTIGFGLAGTVILAIDRMIGRRARRSHSLQERELAQ